MHEKFQVWHLKKDCGMHFHLGCVHMIPISCKNLMLVKLCVFLPFKSVTSTLKILWLGQWHMWWIL
jgi:hypothetical protein